MKLQVGIAIAASVWAGAAAAQSACPSVYAPVCVRNDRGEYVEFNNQCEAEKVGIRPPALRQGSCAHARLVLDADIVINRELPMRNPFANPWSPDPDPRERRINPEQLIGQDRVRGNMQR